MVAAPLTQRKEEGQVWSKRLLGILESLTIQEARPGTSYICAFESQKRNLG